jgi:hypothetical protein
MAEAKLYPHVERYLRSNLGCFHTAQTIGLRVADVTGNIDVVGLRHVGGDLFGDVEVIAVEVKDDEPFLKSAGQTLAYSVMAHRCFLAAVGDFNRHQRDIAAHLGIGLISISTGRRTRCKEVQSAPPRQPVRLMCGELAERMGDALCCVCGSPFRISERKGTLTQPKLVVRGGERNTLATARERELGYVFWASHVKALRRDPRTKGRAKGDWSWDRRYVCPSCVAELGVDEDE